jgi:hypothetical protein
MMRPTLNNIQFDEILSDIETIRKNNILYREKEFTARIQAIDFIEFHVIDRINMILESHGTNEELESLRNAATKVRCHLEEINAKIFYSLRSQISKGQHRGQNFLTLLHEYLDYDFGETSAEEGYDDLDIFLNGLLTFHELPIETADRKPGMVFYQKTPARIILEIIKQAACKPMDVFFDLGSGLGQANILVNLIGSIKSTGVEYEPVFCNYAKSCAKDFQLTDVEFVNSDARYADYSSGNIFFMYTPFEGKILEEVLARLKREAAGKKIRVFSYGPCTPMLAKQKWLISKKEIKSYLKEPCQFESI